MTKVIILGEEPREEKQPKKIEFKKFLTGSGISLIDSNCRPSSYNIIELISKDYGSGLDLMYAYNDTTRNKGTLYLGHFNDGVV